MATSATSVPPGGGGGAARLRRAGAGPRAWERNGGLIRRLGRGGAVVPVLMLGFVFITLLVEALPAVKLNGWSFFSASAWSFGSQYGAPITTGGISHQPGETFGAFPQVIGTLETSAIALIIAVPVSVGSALVIVERLPSEAPPLTAEVRAGLGCRLRSGWRYGCNGDGE